MHAQEVIERQWVELFGTAEYRAITGIDGLQTKADLDPRSIHLSIMVVHALLSWYVADSNYGSIRSAVLEWRGSMIARTFSFFVRDNASRFPVVSVTGPRQSGKSTLVQHVFPDYAYVNLVAGHGGAARRTRRRWLCRVHLAEAVDYRISHIHLTIE